MPDIYGELTKDAEDIAEVMFQEARQAAAEREQIEIRLARIEEIERTAERLTDRLNVLKDVYVCRDQPLCPSCALASRPPSVMQAIAAEDPDSFDAFRCVECGHRTTVPLRDWGTPSGGWMPPV